MADFSALKTSIQNYIKQNGNEEITGNLLQQILLSMVTTLGDSAINDLVTALNAEIANRGNADTELGGRITTLQGVVNGIKANVENGYVYAGIATPSTTPASGKVFYLALTAGTYTNFGATVVPQGINILKYNGSAWSLDSFLGLDDAPTQGSNNFVKSGGVLDSIIKDGSAFDLSAYNSGTTYADLPAALTALNALPAAYKKGGMSFKYVQTSDNKYVQYRLMSDQFTTETEYWEGSNQEMVDIAIAGRTKGIDSILKEGCQVYPMTIGDQSLRRVNNDLEFIDSTAVVHSYGSQLIPNAYYHVYGTVTITNGDSVIVDCDGYPSDETKLISNFGTWISPGTHNIDIIVYLTGTRFSLIKGLNIEMIVPVVNKAGLFNVPLTKGIWYNYGNGDYYFNNDRISSSFIRVGENKKYKIKNNPTQVLAVSFFNKNKEFISAVTTLPDMTFDTSNISNIYYAVLTCVYSSDAESLTINDVTELSELEQEIDDINNNIDELEKNDITLSAKYRKISRPQVNNGFIYGDVGSTIGVNTNFGAWKYVKYNVSSYDYIAISAICSGGSTFACIFTDENDIITKKLYKGENGQYDVLTKETVKVDGYYCYVTTYTNEQHPLSLDCYNIIPEPRSIYYNSPLNNKSAVWLGTSIPATGYPQLIGEILEMDIHNESQGSSICRIGRVTKGDVFGDDLGVTDVPWQNIVLSLSMTQEEKLFIFKRWSTENRKALMISEDGYTAEQVANVVGYGTMMAGTFVGEDTEPTAALPANKPLDYMNSVYKNSRKFCYSKCWNNSTDIETGFGQINGLVEKYLNADSFPDLWILDHGHNDAFNPDINDFATIPTDKFDRSYFIGAMNYIVSKIFSFNPTAKVIVIGHYTNQVGGTDNPPKIEGGQIAFASYWQFPIIKSWELLPFSQAVITTTGYWDSNHVWHDTGFNGTNHVGNNYSGINQNPRQVNGVWVHDLTMKQVWMWDDIHPNVPKTKELYASMLAAELNNLYK